MISIGRKQTKKKIKKRTRLSAREKRQHKHRALIHTILPITGVLVFIVLFFLLLKSTLLSQKYTIRNILYNPESVMLYDDPYLYKEITERVIEKNYYLMKRYALDDIRTTVQDQFPIVSDIHVALSENQHAYVTVDFNQPTLVFQTPTQYVAAFHGTLFPLVSGNTLGDDVLTIQLPRYTSGSDSLYGVLYNLDEMELKSKVTTLIETLGNQYISEIIYLPGGMKLFIAYKGKKVYFHLDQEINRQLAKLIDLENYFQDFEHINTIDLGSIDDIIVR